MSENFYFKSSGLPKEPNQNKFDEEFGKLPEEEQEGIVGAAQGKVIMINNTQNKKMIDGILAKYQARMSALKQKRDKIIFSFLEVLKEKKLEELRNLIKRS